MTSMRKQYSAAFKAQLVKELLREDKPLTQLASEHKVHPNQLRDWKKTALDGLPALFETDKQAAATTAQYEQKVNELYAEIGRLTTHVAWLKKNLVSTLRRPERLALIERTGSELSLVTQAELLNLSRSSLYYQSVEPSAEEIAIKHRFDEIYTQYPFYGSRKIAVLLQREQYQVCRNTVHRYMREMGLAAIYPGPNLSRRELAHRLYPYLLRGLRITHPNHVWGTRITYIRLAVGWMYLVAVLDWYSRYIVSWELDQTLEQPFVMAAVERALSQARPTIWNSDQGSHFTSPQYIERLKAAEVQISMDGKGRALDNIFTERLWRTIKYEEVYLHSYASPKEARRQLTPYLKFYNSERPHQALSYRTPAEVYFGSENVKEQQLNSILKGENPTLNMAAFLS